jgi:hypothetical protein
VRREYVEEGKGNDVEISSEPIFHDEMENDYFVLFFSYNNLKIWFVINDFPI